MSRLAGSQYEVGRIADRCAANGTVFAPGDSVVTALVENEDGDSFRRLDFSLAGWESAARPARVFAYWRSTASKSDGAAGPKIDASSLLGLFEQLEGSEDAKRRTFRYVLALLLMRKRVLMPAGSRQGVLLVKHRGATAEEAAIEVADPAIDDAALADVTDQIRSLLRIEA